MERLFECSQGRSRAHPPSNLLEDIRRRLVSVDQAAAALRREPWPCRLVRHRVAHHRLEVLLFVGLDEEIRYRALALAPSLCAVERV